MWIDIFKINNKLTSYRPKLIDISPRKPLKYQLRVIIYRTAEVVLDDINPVKIISDKCRVQDIQIL